MSISWIIILFPSLTDADSMDHLYHSVIMILSIIIIMLLSSYFVMFIFTIFWLALNFYASSTSDVLIVPSVDREIKSARLISSNLGSMAITVEKNNADDNEDQQGLEMHKHSMELNICESILYI